MPHPDQSFREFELAGWEDVHVVTNYHEHISHVTNQSVVALLDAAGVAAGSQVLDVATGAGYIADAAARRRANVIGVDFSAAQVRLASKTYPGLRFEQADAEALPFEEQSFDAVVNGFGMCHVPNPDIALREAFRVLRPSGRLAFTVYDAPERAVALGAVYAAVRAHGSVDIGLPSGPNFFLFSDPRESTAALLRAGFTFPSYRQVPQVWRVSSPDSLVEAIADGSVRGGATLRAQSSSALQAIKQALRDAFAAYKRDDYFEIPAPALLVAGIKPSK